MLFRSRLLLVVLALTVELSRPFAIRELASTDHLRRCSAANEESNVVGFELGFSFSPGGLLLPYHLGVMSALVESGHVTTRTPLAGSSAGAIAVAAFAAGVPIEATLEGCLRVAARCRAKGGAQGRLLDELCVELDLLLPDDAHDVMARRPAPAILAYRQVFRPENIMASSFASKADLKAVIRASSMVPFYSTPWPVCVCRGRLALDGFFTQPAERFGCPELPPGVARTVTVSVFPHSSVGLRASVDGDSISPAPDADDPSGQVGAFVRRALDPWASDEGAMRRGFESGSADGARWALANAALSERPVGTKQIKPGAKFR